MTLKKLLLFLRLWQYAAMHSPLFRACEFRLINPPISFSASFWGCPTSVLVFRLSLSLPQITIFFPYPIIKSFVEKANSKGESISYYDVDSVLF